MNNSVILKLFKGYVGNKRATKISKEALKYGILIPEAAGDDIINEAIELYGKDGSKWNQTFHKDFNIVKNEDYETLVIEQLIHYFTTYGVAELFGEIKEDLVYIPKEKLEIPELKEDIELIKIKSMNKVEVQEKLMEMLLSGIALSKETISLIMEISDLIDKDRFDEIKNKEIKIALYNKYNIMPQNPEEFLRFLIFKTTGNTLKIKSKDLYQKIKYADNKITLNMLEAYISKNGYNKLASIFLRNKDLFLAFKVKEQDYNYSLNYCYKDEINKIINKLRKLADKNHKPLKEKILDRLTSISNIDEVNEEKILNELEKVTIFNEIRILNGINYRLDGNSAIVYKIRNGKSFATRLENKTESKIKVLEKERDIIKAHLLDRLSFLKDKKIYIPENVIYTMPTSEKQFNGNFPTGSYIELPREDDLIYGIHWKNVNNHQTDLDLHQMNKSVCFGWDASYRDDNSDILFSGDVTNAPEGATELFYVGKNYGTGAFLINLNNFTGRDTVPFEFVIAKANNKQSDFKNNYVIDPNNIVLTLPMEVDARDSQKVIGFIKIADNIRFYLSDYSNGTTRSSRMDEVQELSFDYLNAYSNTQLKLNDILREAGANVIIKKEDDAIDLSPEAITKDSLIELLIKNEE